jgi:glycosyltransferase involved in cell wall biosynthesis
MTPRLTILLPTVEARAKLFAQLHAHITAQAAGKPVEVLVACDNKEISIGKKRQNLLEQATGDYVCYIDDDDWVADDYVDSILAALESSPDCVGFKIRCIMNGGAPLMASASMRYKTWGDNQDGFRFVRSCYHKTPCRRDIALRVGFPDLRYCEDRPYSMGIMRHLKTEEYIDAILYEYRYKHENFAMKYGIKAGLIGSHKRRVDYKGRGVS